MNLKHPEAIIPLGLEARLPGHVVWVYWICQAASVELNTSASGKISVRLTRFVLEIVLQQII